MRFNLHLNICRILFLIILSCFLCLIVAHKNAENKANLHHHHQKTSINAGGVGQIDDTEHAHLTPPADSTSGSDVSLNAADTAAANKQQKLQPNSYQNKKLNNENHMQAEHKKITATTKVLNDASAADIAADASNNANNMNLPSATTTNTPSLIASSYDIIYESTVRENVDSLSINSQHDLSDDVGVVTPIPRPPLNTDSHSDEFNKNKNTDVLNEVPKMEQNVLHENSEREQQQQQKQESASAHSDNQQQSASSSKLDETPNESLPDIKEIPTVTVTELPLEVLQASPSSFDPIIIGAGKDSTQERENRTVEILENSNEAMQKDEQIIKINDSGGGTASETITTTEIPNSQSDENIPNENATNADGAQQQQMPQQNASDTLGIGSNTINLTAEEVPMPVFSEWAQKQMEEAEKQQAMEKEVVNTSTQKKNNTNGSGKMPPLKIRAKNYASPDCGAKIIASNADATHTGAVLSSSKDEYLLSPCGNRIWFVVELCEAIQAQKIDLANFELFSSSPKNFTVAVSNRFPTRDWSNVGRFIAEDKRTVQSFDLHPHLFGKFVRVDIHSHYSKEHFCPVSLFRVFGTSEFEAFETENHPHDDLDDFDEELEQAQAKNVENNLFKSASDAVLSIVKKAAEVLVKPVSTQNQSLTVIQTHALVCHTPAFGQFSCADCNRTLVERINNALSCQLQQLNNLLSVPRLRNDLLNTQVCAKQYGIETKVQQQQQHNRCGKPLLQHPFEMDVKQSYFLNLLPTEYIGALCQLMTENNLQKLSQNSNASMEEEDSSAEVALNLTIDKKLGNGDFKIVENPKKNLLKPVAKLTTATERTVMERPAAEVVATTTTERNSIEVDQIPRPPESESILETETTTQASGMPKEPTPDVNIFNVPAESGGGGEAHVIDTTVEPPPALYEGSAEQLAAPATSTTEATPNTVVTSSTTIKSGDEDAASWENLDNLLTSTVASVTTGGSAQVVATNGNGYNGINLQQKIASGPQSESIFIRLSNRIKTLERNMSLSGQYLEELSRRYKKQVEELQQALTQQTQTVRLLEEQSRRHTELEQLYGQRNAQLKDELDDLRLQVHACIVVVIFVGAFVFLVLMAGILFYRALRRETKELLALSVGGIGKRKLANQGSNSSSVANQKKLNRRKSFEDFSDHQQTLTKSSSEKQRRPSEEAMLILKDCGDEDGGTHVKVEKVGDAIQANQSRGQLRQRKMSVFQEHNNGGNGCSVAANGLANHKAVNGDKRKGEKHSWPNTAHTQEQARKHLEQWRSADEYNKYLCAANFSKSKSHQNQLAFSGGQQNENPNRGKSKKKQSQSQLNYKRQESAPNQLYCDSRLNVTAPAAFNSSPPLETEYDESLRLDYEDLDNFLPNADLAYNEFMPEGPSGYQIIDDVTAIDGAAAKASSSAEKARAKISRRLSPPGFFKTHFSKSLKTKNTNAAATNAAAAKDTHHTPHESTSWEWYRLKKSEAQQKQQKHNIPTSASTGSGFMRSSPAVSLDSSSLSEIHFPTNSTENSFRILEEAILSSGESIPPHNTQQTTNGNGSNNGQHHNHSGSSGDSSNRSSTSSAKKQKRSFNKIFRKVF